MHRSRLRRAQKRQQTYPGKRLIAMPLPAAMRNRPEGERREPSEFAVLATYSETLSAHAVNLEQIKGQQDVSAIEGFVSCAAIVSAILKSSWRDEARALQLAARAVLLSRSFLQEFLDASGGELDGEEQVRLAQSMQAMGQCWPPQDV
jgi:hypothetical protein